MYLPLRYKKWGNKVFESEEQDRALGMDYKLLMTTPHKVPSIPNQ